MRWDPKGPDAQRLREWERRYALQERLWRAQMNPTLASVASELSVGTALDVACGEGGDAIGLALDGWHVTGVDGAPTAISRAVDHARKLGVGERCEFVTADVFEWRATTKYDLVTTHYFHESEHFGTVGLFSELLVPAVAPGGTLLIVGHSGFPSWSEPARNGVTLPGPDEVVASLELGEGWTVVEAGLRPRTVTSPDGEREERPDVVVRVRRS